MSRPAAYTPAADALIRLMLAAWLGLAAVPEVRAAPHHGFAAQHRSLARVARLRGMDERGVLFASPLVPLGTRLCVASAIHPDRLCGLVVDVPQPEHRAWQLAEGRIVEVDPQVARLLCRDAAGPPSSCPVLVWRER